jgi:hypothetical protein
LLVIFYVFLVNDSTAFTTPTNSMSRFCRCSWEDLFGWSRHCLPPSCKPACWYHSDLDAC